ncbi:hypothetical protein A2634_02245 [Candidatus Amesbacteria bacterium RIFCSPHIGHO2_01_FULL_48_32]|uniref:D-glycerate dehydrogenase n=1 Tax=Candidatus Amesbacteria bacterium RIFCSPLOWO2_01_FULL_48_25 TaxID=1797259 RepID=A0A1F4ZET9_9BACT|nr:MAG: hypothetical protein A2634_02245 [Candidatus Amesbacteria bacterium RIFCSPHIGHO2_01_FULL_48_32]OGD04406.1 MAG: hypothetical protein A2989_05250 [Candidatus Amesbacteria bacterium RIFCSPLOWO2_01_FULL_48_25]HJZ06246.1 D-glycerate dehydrogenase [Patescibacteria group bacterium]
MARVFVTRKLPFWEEISKPLFDGGHEVVFGKSEQLDDSFEGLLCLLTDRIDKDLLGRAKSLRVIANYAVGYDNIDVQACEEKGVRVSNTPCDEVNESVAEFAWALMLALSRRLPEAAEYARNAAYHGWEPEIFIGGDLKGRTLGIIGAGRIGSMVAKRAEGWEMRVMSYSRSSGLKLEEVLGQSDFVSLHVPLTSETRHLINKKSLGAMKKGAILVNTARGPVVDEAEVAEALRAGFLGGYGADVFENEPNPYAELLQMENVILTPHIASATVAARKRMGELAVLNLVEGLAGREMPNLVK